MFYAYSHTRTYSHHICIWREIKRHLQHLYKHSPYSTFQQVKKEWGLPIFWPPGATLEQNFMSLISPLFLNKRVYLLKIKLLMQQTQSQDSFCQSDNIFAWVQEWINCNMITLILMLKLRLSFKHTFRLGNNIVIEWYVYTGQKCILRMKYFVLKWNILIIML